MSDMRPVTAARLAGPGLAVTARGGPRARSGSRRSTSAARQFQGQPARLLEFWIFLVLFVVTLFAEFIANDRPL
jgi:hypothetical protein